MVLDNAMCNKRAFTRLEKVFRVSYSLSSPCSRVLQSGTTTTSDISLGGVRLFIQEKLARGIIVDIDLNLDGRRVLHLQGKVVWSLHVRHGFFCGLEFVSRPGDASGILLQSFFGGR